MPNDPLHPDLPAPAKFDPKDWLWTMALRKGVTMGAKTLAAWLIAHNYADLAAHILAAGGVALGVPIVADPALIEAALTAVGASALTMARNWLKLKTSWGARFL